MTFKTATRKSLMWGMVAASLTLSACAKQPAAAPAASAPAPPAAAPVQHTPAHWSYEGDTKPDKWANLDTSFSACANGTEQSPIDIELSQVQLDKSLEDLKPRYAPAAFTLMNNGHTIQLNESTGANVLTLDGQEYKLAQMHFHKPSENQINGKSFEMELHLVHKNSKGELAVVGILIQPGAENKALAEAFSKLPKGETKEDLKLSSPIDLNQLLPSDLNAYHYNGSLTTPPCSEGVKWAVLQQPITLSAEQIAAFAAIFRDNHRPVQPVNQRKVVSH